MINSAIKQGASARERMMGSWFEELVLPVAPACNMMCNFCSKDSDCMANANNPGVLSKVMTPRQAVGWAVSCANKNKRIKVIRISGPGEPLFNRQTFEVLKRLNTELPGHIYAISTNGLLLKDKIDDLIRLNVKTVDVSINSLYAETSGRLYSRIIKDDRIITDRNRISEELLNNQIEGVKACLKNGIEVMVNTVCLLSINGTDVINIGSLCRELGVESMRLISSSPDGKLKGVRIPDMSEMSMFYETLSKSMQNVEIKSFYNG